jgi:chorismate--pyruvate lyase
MIEKNFNWISKEELESSQDNLQENTYNWLVLPNNLTETIKKTGATFSLNVLKQSFDKPYADEINAFHDYPIDASFALIRKVILEGDGLPMIFARVIVPEATYLNYQEAFTHLGNAAIGNTLLYNDDNVVRKRFEYKLVTEQDDIFHELKTLNKKEDADNLWARRSIFVMPKGYLLITEVFLKALPTYP